MNKKIVIVMGILVTMTPAFGADGKPSPAELRQTMLDAIARRTQTNRPAPPPVAHRARRPQAAFDRPALPPVAHRVRRPEAAFDYSGDQPRSGHACASGSGHAQSGHASSDEAPEISIDFSNVEGAIQHHDNVLFFTGDQVVRDQLEQKIEALRNAVQGRTPFARKRLYEMHLAKLQREKEAQSEQVAREMHALEEALLGHEQRDVDADAEFARQFQQEEWGSAPAPDTTEDDELALALAMSLGEDPDAHGAPAQSDWAREEAERLSLATVREMQAQEEQIAIEEAASKLLEDEATRLLIEQMQRGEV